jgi:non-ribosomal peptide synthetase-like protein
MVYPLYGFHYRMHRSITRLTNIKFFTHLFGDSSYVVHYLRGLGYDLARIEQTGSNFGMEVAHDNPYLSSIGSGTMVADGLSIVNAEFSSTSFRVSPVSIGPRNFLGNAIAYPAGGRTGDNCLLATKVMVPLDGKIREGVGLLGSPCFEIPRSVERDSRFDELRVGDELRHRLAAKNRHNLRTMGVYLVARWLHAFLLMILGVAAFDLSGPFAVPAITAFFMVSVLVGAAQVVVLEHMLTAFHALRPTFCSIYDPDFWRHERLWKVPGVEYLRVFDGTPFKNAIWRLMGVRIGRRVFDDGCYLTERALVTVGDDCMLNAGSKVQCHSQEDGTFKSDRSAIGSGCTVGVGALVHYGVTMGDGAVLAPDSFLMKGEEVPPRASWGGNPARETRAVPVPAGPMPVLPIRPTRRHAPALVVAALVGVVAADLVTLASGVRASPVPARQGVPLTPTPSVVASPPAARVPDPGNSVATVPHTAVIGHRTVSRPVPERAAAAPTTGVRSSGTGGPAKDTQREHRDHEGRRAGQHGKDTDSRRR